MLCSIRPHALALRGADGSGNRIAAAVEQVRYLGERVAVRLRGAANTPLEMVSLPHLAGRLQAGDQVTLTVPPEHVVILQDSE